jgi:RNA polymerase sigma-70 factor (ECF subfamily)
MAFEALYARHSGRVYEYLKKKTTEENARELLQEIFLKVHRSRHRYSSQYPFLPWIFAISRNAVIDLIRRNETKVARSSDVEPEAAAPPAEDREWAPDLASALRALPANQRRAIELRYVQDWTFERIAGDLKTTPANARQVISRAIKKLRSAFGGRHG